MDDLHKSIAAAQKKQKQTMLAGAGVVLIAMLGIVIWLVGLQSVQIEISPPEAAGDAIVTGDGTFIVAGRAWTLGSGGSVNAIAPGFRQTSRPLSDARDGLLDIYLEELDARFVLSTNADAEDIRWVINGKVRHIGPELIYEANPGSIEVIARHPSFEDSSAILSGSRGEIVEHRFDMISASGSITVSTIPQGPEIILNGQSMGSGQIKAMMPAGKHLVEINDPAWKPVSDEIVVSAAEPNIERHYKLIPADAYVTVSVSKPGGILLLDGRKISPGVEQTISSNQNHKLEYRLHGHDPATSRFTLQPGQSRKITLGSHQAFGTLNVVSNDGATIRIDGVVAGAGRIGGKMAAGRYEIEASKPGFRTVRQNATVTGNQQTLVKIELIDEQAARLKEGKKPRSATIGLSYKTFRPQKLNFGSPPNEVGRQSNEPWMKVTFDRPIMVSKTEVTNAAWAAFKKSHGKKDKMPVTDISWDQAALFCNWLSEDEGLAPFYIFENGKYTGFNKASNGWRLPTEAEWEWLAKKANRRVETPFVWGNQSVVPKDSGNLADEQAIGKVSVYIDRYDDGHATMAPVASYRADRAGLHDLAGNASEWVHDFYAGPRILKGMDKHNPFGPASGRRHVVKGSNWKSGRFADLRASVRKKGRDKDPLTGFRILRYADKIQ